jgi:hypothetical protein
MMTINKYALIVICLITQVSCSVGTTYFIFNSSGTVIELHYGAASLKIVPDQLQHIEYFGSNQDQLVIEAGEQQWKYSLKLLPNGHFEVDGKNIELPYMQFSKRKLSTSEFYFQVDPSGRICPVLGNRTLPASVIDEETPYCVSPSLRK